MRAEPRERPNGRGTALFVALAFTFAAPHLAGAVQADAPSSDRGGRLYGSVYLGLEHWAYTYIDLLMARGHLESLSALVQPYRRIDVARALLEAERSDRLAPAERTWVDQLEGALAREMELLASGEDQEAEFGAEVALGMKALSHTHRDPLRPEGPEKIFPQFELRLTGEAPWVAGVFGGRWDNHFLNDPQFPEGRAIERRECDPMVDECAYRLEEAYVELQVPYVRLSIGRMYRNWGLPGRPGLLLADYAYSYDQVGYRFGTDRIALSGLYAPFADFPGDTNRHFATHRFDWRIRDNLQIAVGESVVFGGPNRPLELNLINPIAAWEISGLVGGQERNSLGQAEVWWRPFDNLVTYGSFLVDNTSVGDEELGKESGLNQYAGALGLQIPRLRDDLAVRVDFTVASALAYRTQVAPWQFYTVDEIGLALDKTDMVLVSLQADWLPRPRLVLQPRVDLLWKGEDDIRDTWPEGALADRDKLLIGIIEKTVRPSIQGLYQFPRGDVRWDLGLNLVKDEDHVPRDWQVEAVGRIVVRVRERF